MVSAFMQYRLFNSSNHTDKHLYCTVQQTIPAAKKIQNSFDTSKSDTDEPKRVFIDACQQKHFCIDS